MTAALVLFELPRSAYRLRACPVCAGSLSLAVRPGTVTYVVQRQGWVKIGKTSQLDVRLRVLRLHGPNGAGMVKHPPGMTYAEPLILLRTFAGDVEHDLHERWQDDHAGGEWFMPSGPMRAWLAAP